MTTRRECGDCMLCCSLLPVEEFGKAAGERCQFAKFGKGCSIYSRRPGSCELWNCRWLVNDDTAELRRPDRSHYVIDIMPDFCRAVHDTDPSQSYTVEVIQVWVDPKYRGAHRDPAFRRYLDRQGKCALIRYGSHDGFLLAPPSVTNGHGWIEKESGFNAEPQHTLQQIAAELGGEIEIGIDQATVTTRDGVKRKVAVDDWRGRR